ncbi:MAG: hypothetical protein ACJAXM_000735 [Arenicella sp.]|jgi:hypothetical protein
MQHNNVVWLASYPRSGNTFLRTILWQCFGLRSASVYPNDLGGNTRLEDYVGHIDYPPGQPIQLSDSDIHLKKTHEYDQDNMPAIYVIRDGRAAAVSLSHFYDKTLSLAAVIEGQHRFGTWSDHVNSWRPWERPNTLLLKYESILNDLPATLNTISTFLKRDLIKTSIPDRSTIAAIDDNKALTGNVGQWVSPNQKDWRTELSGELLNRFNVLNHDVLIKAGYLT